MPDEQRLIFQNNGVSPGVVTIDSKCWGDATEIYANSFQAFRNLKGHVRELKVRRTAASNHGLHVRTGNVVPLKHSP
jgi:hypothetical protein